MPDNFLGKYDEGKPAPEQGEEIFFFFIRYGRCWVLATSQEIHPPIIFLCIPYLASSIFMPSTAPLPDNFYFYTMPTIATI